MRKLWSCFFWFGCAIVLSSHSTATENLQNVQWNPYSGIKVAATNEAGSYRVWGSQSGAWSYARVVLRNLSPKKGEKYRLEARVKVTSISSNAMPPFLNIGSNRNNQFVKNYSSQKYNISSKGQWQKLWREFEVEDSDLGFMLAIDKGTTNALDVELEIKDIKFSKISSYTELGKVLALPLSKSQPASCEHPCLHLNSAKVASLKKQISQNTYAKFWAFVEKAANEYTLQRPPADAYKKNEATIREIGDRLPYLGLAFLVTGDQRYLKSSRKWFNAILSYEEWASNEDIGAAHLLYGLSITYDWLYDQLDESEKKAIAKKVERQANILARSLIAGNIGWSRNYLNNHNYVNAMALGVAGRAFQKEIPDAEVWVQASEQNFAEVLNALSSDGASHEGIGYWGYGFDALLKYYDAVATEPMRERFRDSGYFRNASIYRLYMSLPGFAQNADYADSPRQDYSGPGYLLRKLSAMFDDGRAQWLAITIEQARTLKQFSWLDLLWYDDSIVQQEPFDLPLTHYFNNLGIVVSRTSWKANASWVFYKAGDPQGKYAKTLGLYEGGHIHPDAGNVLWWANGGWVLQDDGFTPVKATENHNVMTFNGYGQLGEGQQWFDREGFVDNSRTAIISRVNFSDDFSAVESYVGKIYPLSAGVKQWKRTLFWLDSYLIVHDNLELNSSTNVKGYFNLSDGELFQSGSGYGFRPNDSEKLCIYNSASEDTHPSYSHEKMEDYKYKYNVTADYNTRYRDNHRIVFTTNMRGSNLSHTTVFDSSPSKNCGKSISIDGDTIKISDNSTILSCGLDSLECYLGKRPRAVPQLRVE